MLSFDHRIMALNHRTIAIIARLWPFLELEQSSLDMGRVSGALGGGTWGRGWGLNRLRGLKFVGWTPEYAPAYALGSERVEML